MSFTIFQNEKTVFYAIKTRISKVEKLTFSQRVTHDFSPKIAIFLTFFLRPNRPEKCLLRYSRSKKSPSRLQKQEFQKIDIFSKRLTHGFGRRMSIFPSFFFQPIQARKMSFTIFQNAKTPFQAIKTRTSKSRKIDILPKGLSHDFSSKMVIFPIFFFYPIQARKKSFTSFQNQKNAFLGYENKNFKKSKN